MSKEKGFMRLSSFGMIGDTHASYFYIRYVFLILFILLFNVFLNLFLYLYFVVFFLCRLTSRLALSSLKYLSASKPK